MLPSLNSSPFNAKKCSWAQKNIFKRSYIDFYCGEEITLSSSSYFSEYLKLKSKRVPVLQTPCCSSTGKWETHIVAREVDESYISYAEPFTVDHKLPSLPLRPMKSCLKLVFRQAPRLLQLPIGTQSHRAVALDWPGDKERLCVCVSVTHTCCGGIGAFVSFCVIVSLWASRWKQGHQPLCSFWKISSILRAPLLRQAQRKWSSACQNTNMEGIMREALSLLWILGFWWHCRGLHVWTGGPVKRWQLEFCFLLCAEAVFAEWDKTWFLWQGKGKLDMLYISNCVHVCLSAMIHSSLLRTFQYVEAQKEYVVWLENSSWALLNQHCPLVATQRLDFIRNQWRMQRKHHHSCNASFLHTFWVCCMSKINNHKEVTRIT